MRTSFKGAYVLRSFIILPLFSIYFSLCSYKLTWLLLEQPLLLSAFVKLNSILELNGDNSDITVEDRRRSEKKNTFKYSRYCKRWR